MAYSAGCWGRTYQNFQTFSKGKGGGTRHSTHVKLYLDEGYILINDVTLPDELGGTTQIRPYFIESLWGFCD